MEVWKTKQVVTPDDLSFAQDIARAAGKLFIEGMHDARSGQVSKSSPTDIATATDLLAEQLIVDAIKDRFPDDGIIAEEGGSTTGTTGRCWIIDPLDGTANFVRGIWPSVISIGIAILDDATTSPRLQDLVAGVIFDPVRDEMFVALHSEGSYKNGTKLWRGDNVTPFEQSVVGISGTNRQPHRTHKANIMYELAQNTDAVKDLGSTALHLCAVADGRFDAHIGADVNIWDVAAGFVIAREAGCELNGFTMGTPASHQQFVVTAPNLTSQMSELVLRALAKSE